MSYVVGTMALHSTPLAPKYVCYGNCLLQPFSSICSRALALGRMASLTAAGCGVWAVILLFLTFKSVVVDANANDHSPSTNLLRSSNVVSASSSSSSSTESSSQRSLSIHGNCMAQQHGGELGCIAQDMKFKQVTSLSIVNHSDDDLNSPIQLCNCTSDYTTIAFLTTPCTDPTYDLDCGPNPINTIYGACTGNDATVQVSFTVDFDVGPTRYDVGMYIATDGGSAMNGDECLITGLNPGSYSDGAVVVEETDGDMCNDIETTISSGTVVMRDYAFESLTLSCTDSNNDGLLDFDVGIAWSVQKGKYDCNIDDPAKAPVASSYPKCWYDQNERITLNIFVPNNSSPSSQPSQSSQPTGSPSQSSQPTGSMVIDDPPETTDAPTSTPSSQSTSDCVGRVNVCFALDMSGSVCSPDFSNPQQCFGCQGECNEDPFDLATCCSNFNEVRTFAIAMVESLDPEQSTSQEFFSIVQFATSASVVTGLASSSETVNQLNDLVYSGGYTNHAAAIDACHQTLSASTDADRKPVILLVTDGVATRPEADPYGAASVAASTAKEEGTVILPVYISAENQGDMTYMEGLSSDGTVTYLNNFSELQQLVHLLAPQIACNNPPIAIDDFAIAEYEKFVDIPVLDNDFDPDGDEIQIQYNLIKMPDNGVAVVFPDSIYYFPHNSFTGIDVFIYQICESGGLCDEANVTVTVQPPTNNGPVANDDFVTSPCNGVIDILVLDNDWDDDGDALTVTIVNPSMFGSTEVNADGSVTYTSNGIYCGVLDIFLYEICDTAGACDQALVHVTINSPPTKEPTPLPTQKPTKVPTKQPTPPPSAAPTNPPTPVNNPPEANDDYVTVQCGGTITDIPILINDFDPDEDPLTIIVDSEPSNGIADLNVADSTISYTPYTSNGNVCKNDTFSYQVCDDSWSCDNAIVHITVTNLPVANDDFITTLCETSIHVPVMINDYHPDGVSITITSVTANPSNGSVVINDDGTITYTPDKTCVRTDVFKYQVCDTRDDCDEATVTVTVLKPTSKPSSMPSLLPSIMPSEMPSNPPTFVEWYYPDWSHDKELCINNANPEWIRIVQYDNYLYKSKEECCHKHFWWRITQCMSNEHSMYFSNGDKCEQKVYFPDHDAKFTPQVWDASKLFFTMEDCCANTHWWNMTGCMAGSPLQYRFVFRLDIFELKDPEFCQMANLLAGALRVAMENGLDDKETMVNVTSVGCATLTREFETGNPMCGGCLEGETWLGDTNGREDTSPANGATSTVEIEITAPCYHSKTEAEIDQEMDEMIDKVHLFVESGGYEFEIHQWSQVRDPPVKSLWPTKVVSNSFEVLSLHNPFRVEKNHPWYPDWSRHQTCVNDGLQDPYMNEEDNKGYYVFEKREDCCKTWFGWDSGCNTVKFDSST